MMTPEAAMQCIGHEKLEAMRTIEFWVEGDPKGKERPRPNRFGRPYTPKNTVAYEKKIREACEKQCPTRKAGFLGPVELEVRAYYRIPKSTTKKARAFMLEGKSFPTKTPDGDNICKAVLDAINGVAFADDKQVVEIAIKKRYTTTECPGVHVIVRYWPWP